MACSGKKSGGKKEKAEKVVNKETLQILYMD